MCSVELPGFTAVRAALQGDVLEQLHPHLAGGAWSVGIPLHQHKVGVMAVQGVDGAVGEVLRLVHSRLVRLQRVGEAERQRGQRRLASI